MPLLKFKSKEEIKDGSDRSDDSCYFMSIPLEVRHLIYNKLDNNSILTCRLISQKCQQEINGLYTFTCKSIKLNENDLKPCEMRLTIEFCSIEKMWKPCEMIFLNLIQINELFLDLGKISIQNLIKLMDKYGPYVKHLDVLIPCIFNNTPRQYHWDYFKKTPYPFEYRKLTLLKSTDTWGYFEKHPGRLNFLLGIIAFESAKIDTICVSVKFYYNCYDNGEEIKQLAKAAISESVTEFYSSVVTYSNVNHIYKPCNHTISIANQEQLRYEPDRLNISNPIRRKCIVYEVFTAVMAEMMFCWTSTPHFHRDCRRLRSKIGVRVPVLPSEGKVKPGCGGEGSSTATREWIYRLLRGNRPGQRILQKETEASESQLSERGRKQFRWSVFGMICHSKWYAYRRTYSASDVRNCR